MAQPFIGKLQWEEGDPRPVGRDPRVPNWLGRGDVEVLDRRNLFSRPHAEVMATRRKQREFLDKSQAADYSQQLLDDFQNLMLHRRGPNDQEKRVHLEDRLMEDENAAVQIYRDLGYGKNPGMWNKVQPKRPLRRHAGMRIAPPRMLIDNLYRE